MTASILIPAYNASNFLTATLESCVNQGEENVHEIIVIDDQSGDDTLAVAQHFAKAHPQFDFVLKLAGKRRVSARNQAYALATGEAIQWLDADDTWTQQTENPA